MEKKNYSESIEKMNSKQFDNFIWAMYQNNDYCVFGDDEFVESDMWNFAQCINDNYDLEDEDELNKAKDLVIRFFDGEYNDEYTDTEWDNFEKVTGEFLASYFGEKQTPGELFDYCVNEYLNNDESGVLNNELYSETKKLIDLIDNGTIGGYTVEEVGACCVAGANTFHIVVKPSYINKGKRFCVTIDEKRNTLRIGSTESDITDYSKIKSQFIMAAMNEFCGFDK